MYRGDVDIIIELPYYDNLSVLQRYYYENLMSSSSGALDFMSGGKRSAAARARHARFKLPSVSSRTSPVKSKNAVLVWRSSPSESVELPSINARFLMKKHRYTYGVVDRGESTFCDGLGKTDCLNRTTEIWSTKGHTPSEPVFVPNPTADSDDEDAGMLLSVVLDGFSETSYLLVLDAKTMKEVGRAETGIAIHHGFHGVHSPQPVTKQG